MGDALRDVGYSVKEASRLTGSLARYTAADMAREVQNRTCRTCAKFGFCEGRTEKAMAAAAETLVCTGTLDAGALPETLDVCCREKAALLGALREAYRKYAILKAADDKVMDLKLASGETFSALADALSDAGKRLSRTERVDPYLSALALDAFRETGLPVQAVHFEQLEGVTLLSAVAGRLPRDLPVQKLLLALFQKTGLRFSAPQRTPLRADRVLLTFCEETPFRLDVCAVRKEAEGETLCGDAVRTFYDGEGSFYCVLSDGMGTGKTAALDSAMTGTLTSRLLKAGFSPEAALKSVNTALLTKNTDESLATLDVLQIDLYTGRARFLKAGGTFSAVKRGNKTVIVEKSSLPLGILRDTGFQESELTLSKGDAVILISDGADRVKKAFFKELFRTSERADAKALCAAVLDEAVRIAPIGHRDDITVAAVRVVISG